MATSKTKMTEDRPVEGSEPTAKGPDIVTAAGAERRLIAAERRAEQRLARATAKHAAAEASLARRQAKLATARQTLRERQDARMVGPAA